MVVAVIYIPKATQYHTKLACDIRLARRGVVASLEMAESQVMRPCRRCFDSRGYVPTPLAENWERTDW